MPQALVNARVERGFEWRAHSARSCGIRRGARLNGSGRVLIRPSGTEPVLRVMVEASEAEIAEAMAQRLASTLRPGVRRNPQ